MLAYELKALAAKEKAHNRALRRIEEETRFAQRRQVQGGSNVGVSSTPGGQSISFSPPLVREQSALVCMAMNDGPSVLRPHECAMIRGSLIDARDWRLNQGALIVVDEPDGAVCDHPAEDDVPFAIAVDPIMPGSVGRVCVSGVIMAYVIAEYGTTQEDLASLTNAKIMSDYAGTHALLLASDGAAEVLWRDETYEGASPTSKHLALIRFPVGGGGGIIQVDTYEDLPEIEYPAFGYTKDLERLYFRMSPAGYGNPHEDGEYWWGCISHLEDRQPPEFDPEE